MSAVVRRGKSGHEVWTEAHGEHGPEVRCICGWRKWHARAKVRDRAADAHLTKHRDQAEGA